MKVRNYLSFFVCAALIFSMSCTAQAAVFISTVPVSSGECGQTFVVKDDGTLWAWGGDTTEPFKIMDGVVSAAAGSMHGLAVKSDGSLFGWGNNTYGQLGLSREGLNSYMNGSAREYFSDTPVKIMDEAASVAANGVNSYIIKNDRTLWAFGGDEKSGEYLVGDGTASQPKPVKIMDNVALISAGGSNALVLKADGNLFMWGDNASGEIGDGTTIAHTTPVKVMDDVATAAQGTFHTLAVKKDGSLWAWGSNYGGGLGDGTNKDSTVPVKIMEDVVSAAAGTCHSLAVKKDGSLWAWGQGVRGFAGNKGYNYTPENILEDVVYVSSKQSLNYAVKSDGSLWAWGDGINLGNIYSTPFPREAMYGISKPGVFTESSAVNIQANGNVMVLGAYNINDSNYFKLRDIAMAINGTAKQFEVGWDRTENSIMLTADEAYTPVGGELAVPGTPILKAAAATRSKIYLDGREIQLAAYNIGDNNYFKLRDIAKVFNFSVTWDKTASTIGIDTSKAYDAEADSGITDD